MIELENRTRSVFHFPVVKRMPPPEGVSGPGTLKETRRVILGDSADRDVKNADPKLQPSPVIRMTSEEFAELGPRNIRVLRALIAKGDVQLRELAA